MNKCLAIRSIVTIAVVGCIALLLASCGHKPQAGGDISKVAVKFADDVVNNRYTAIVPYLDDTMKSQLTESRLTQVTSAIKQQLGNHVSSGTPVLRKIQGYDAVYIPYQFQRGSQDIKVVFDGNGKIAGLFFVNHGSL
ncbi:MAG: DUF3887 domain-containing protein [Armatimonadota bacterium]|nr:DUF3887 domain-containing protein [bacterium]